MSAIILLRFNETTKLMPSDELGNLADLQTVGVTAPVRVSAWAGFGRRFVQASSHGFVAADLSGKGTLLQRDATIQVLVSLALSGATGPQTILARGINDGSASERYAYGLELQEQTSFPGFVEVRWFWQDSGGTIRTQAPAVFQHAGDGVEFMLTATRRWESTSRVVVRYYVGDQLIAEIVSADGDISGGTTGRTTIGLRRAAGIDSRFLNGTIDELLVLDNELSAEELRHTWKRLTEYQPSGVETLLGLAPPGATWAKDPGNDVGRLTKIAGQLLGLGVAGAEEVRALTLPDAVPVELAGRWEAFCELAAAPGDSLDVRRTRIASYLAREEGFSLSPIKQALSGPMALAVEQIVLDEFDNTITEDFSAGISSAWLDGAGASWSATTGALVASAPAGVDLRWESRASAWLLRPNEPGRLWLQAKVSGFVGLAQNVFGGMALHNRHSNDWLWFGVYNNAGTQQLVVRAAQAGGPPTANTVLVASAGAGPYWLRIATPQGAPFVDQGLVTLSYSTTSSSAGFTDVLSVNSGITAGWLWAGFALYSTVAATPSASTCTFDDLILHNRDSVRPFIWYAYRDPALPGNPDMIGADRLVRKIKPAYTHAAAISRRAVICDDLRDGLCDRGPTV